MGAVRPTPTAALAAFALPDLPARRLDLAIKVNSSSIKLTHNLVIMLKRHDSALIIVDICRISVGPASAGRAREDRRCFNGNVCKPGMITRL